MTLEKSKGYGLQERTQTLLDLSRSRLNGPTPHQAPQRERVSRAASAHGGSRPRRRTKRWTELLRPDHYMGVPQLMMILEPNIVWDHTKAFCDAVGKDVEASYAAGEFFEGWHKAGRLAHGVYEGSYWELLGDCDEMIDMLKKLANAPPLLEEPPLDLPAAPELPKWEDFKPLLQQLPSAPQLPQLKLPPFRSPLLEYEVPFIAPDFIPLPDVPDAAQEEPMPVFFPPEVLAIDAYEEPEFVELDPPIMPSAPPAPAFGKPEHGHDWTGQHPYKMDEPVYHAPPLMDTGRWFHPPRDGTLPRLPLLDELQLDRANLDLEPIPKIELAWECGPEPEPSYASMATTPRCLSRAGSPPRSAGPSTRPSSAVAPSRPLSAGPARPSAGPASRPSSAGGPLQGSGPSSAGPSSRPASAMASSRPHSVGPGSPPLLASRLSSMRKSSSGSIKGEEFEPADLAAWDDVVEVDAGKPRVWLNFDKPFAELPPVFMPPRPEQGVVNGPEPMPEDFPHDQLDDVPAFTAPVPRTVPNWSLPQLKMPQWMPPCEPRPIGFIRGTAPVLIIDVSGTMNPRQQGKFKEMKECVCELLDTDGELSTAAAAFDVIAFCSGAWSWSATYAARLSLLASAQVFYSGRQAGGKQRPNSSRAADKAKCGISLQPTEPELLADAQNWVDKWPDAVGHTSMLASFQMADEHWEADCWYIFSDGLADDPSLCMEFLEARIRHGRRVPIIHTIGFFPDGCTDNFEGRRYLQQLSAMTGGTFQEYDKNLHRIYQDGIGFVNYDLSKEQPEETVEREWSEAQLRAERKKNIRLGIIERLDVTLARVQAMHDQLRVQPARAANAEALAAARAAYDAAVADVQDYNANMTERAQQEYDQLVQEINMRNHAKVDAARAAYEEAHCVWVEVYEVAVAEWEASKAGLEKEREQAMEALNALQVARGSRSPSPPRSRPQSAPRSRPTSAQPNSLPASHLLGNGPGPSRSRPVSATTRESSPRAATENSAAAAARAGLASHASLRPRSSMGAPAGAGSTSRPTSASKTAAAGGAGLSSRPMSASRSRPASASTGAAAAGAAKLSLSGSEQQHPQAAWPQSATAGNQQQQQHMIQPYADEEDDLIGDDLLLDQYNPAAVLVQPLYAAGEQVVRALMPDSVSRAELLADEPEETDALADIAEEEHGSDLFDDELPALELEDSQELKRRIFPEAVVRQLDDDNAAKLAEIRAEWQLLLAETEARNQKKLEVLIKNQATIDKYADDVISAYADSFVKDVVMGVAVRTVVNERLTAAAQTAHAAEVARIQRENERLAQLHRQEVEDKQFREEQHQLAMQRLEMQRREIQLQHEADVARAKALHAENVARGKEEWEQKLQEVEELNAMRLREAEAMHARMVDDVREVNKRYQAEYDSKLAARHAVEERNQERLAEAQLAHKERLERLKVDNEERLRLAQEDHQALCMRLQLEHEEAKKAAQKEFDELRVFLTQHNEALTEEARKKFQEAMTQAQAEFDELCASICEQHALDLEAVRQHNQEIWPLVQVAQLALAELGRVQAFAEHIRFCANKFEVGVNFMPNTPNYDRVVEMQALTEALHKAFPDYAPSSYPWPDHERKGDPGTGWTPSPTPKPLVYKDPATEIMRIAAGRTATSRPSSASIYMATPNSAATAASSHQPLPSSRSSYSFLPGPEPPLARPSTAPSQHDPASTSGRLTPEAMARPSTAFSQLPSATRVRFSSIDATTIPTNSSRSPLTSRPASSKLVGHLSPQSSTASAAFSGGPSRGPSPRQRGHYPHAGTPVAAAARAGYGHSSSWPASAAAAAQSNRPLSAAALMRPASAQPHLPARFSVDLNNMHQTLKKLNKASGAKPELAGFGRDLPRLKYPEVDVQTLD